MGRFNIIKNTIRKWVSDPNISGFYSTPTNENKGLVYDITNDEVTLKEATKIPEMNEIINIAYRWVVNDAKIEAKFDKKCLECGMEFKNNIEEHEHKNLVPPDLQQLEYVKQFMKDTDERHTPFELFCYSILFYWFILDKVLITFQPNLFNKVNILKELKTEKVKQTFQIKAYVEDPTKFKIFFTKSYIINDDEMIYGITDEADEAKYGKYFCPLEPTVGFTQKEYDKLNGKCNIHAIKHNLVPIAMIQELNDNIVIRYSSNEFLYLTRSPLPNVDKPTRFTQARDALQLLIATRRRIQDSILASPLNGILFLKNIHSTDAEELAKSLNSVKDRFVSEDKGLRRSLRPYVGVINALDEKADVSFIRLISDDRYTDFLEVYQRALYTLYNIYGIVNSQYDSRDIRPSSLTLNEVTTQETRNILYIIFDTILEKHGITDYIIRFGDLEKVDNMRKAQTNLLNARAITELANNGIEATIENGNLVIKGKIKPQDIEKKKRKKSSTTLRDDTITEATRIRTGGVSDRTGEDVNRNETPAQEER